MYIFRKCGFEEYFEYQSKIIGSSLSRDGDYKVLLTPDSDSVKGENANAAILGKLWALFEEPVNIKGGKRFYTYMIIAEDESGGEPVFFELYQYKQKVRLSYVNGRGDVKAAASELIDLLIKAAPADYTWANECKGSNGETVYSVRNLKAEVLKDQTEKSYPRYIPQKPVIKVADEIISLPCRLSDFKKITIDENALVGHIFDGIDAVRAHAYYDGYRIGTFIFSDAYEGDDLSEKLIIAAEIWSAPNYDHSLVDFHGVRLGMPFEEAHKILGRPGSNIFENGSPTFLSYWLMDNYQIEFRGHLGDGISEFHCRRIYSVSPDDL